MSARCNLKSSITEIILKLSLSYCPAKQDHPSRLVYVAIQGHWLVEVLHYQRDVVLSEDAFRSRFSGLQRTVSSLSTLTMSLLQWLNPLNMTAQLQQFAERVEELIDFLRLKRVL